MNKAQAETIYTLTNHPDWDALIEVFKSRIEKMHLDLEWQIDREAMKTQGRIAESRFIIGLKDNVNDVLSRNNS
jgi:hypothetical protein